MATTAKVGVSDHAENRLLQHEGYEANVIDAWHGGLPLTDHGCHGDEARYDPDYDVVLVRKDSDIVTVINHEPEMRPQTKHAVAKAVKWFGEDRLER